MWECLVAVLVCIREALGGDPLLDALMSGEAARARLATMDAAQRRVHLLGTATLDMLYPFAYGGLLLGGLVRTRAAPRWRWCVALGVAMDFVENVAQIIALAGAADTLGLKTVVTSVKFGSLLLALIVICVSAARAAYRRYLAGRG